MNNCIFCSLIDKTIPSTIIYEDNEFLAFNDINPQALVHFLVIPKLHLTSMLDLNISHQELLGKMMILANSLAVKSGLKDGYKLQINTGTKGGQEVMHLHIHIVGN